MARKIPFEDPQVLLYVRVAYVAVQVIILGTYYYVSMKVCSIKADNKKTLFGTLQIKQKNDLTTLKYGQSELQFCPLTKLIQVQWNQNRQWYTPRVNFDALCL